jgi:O-antigen/teichoic acid export membrane protein
MYRYPESIPMEKGATAAPLLSDALVATQNSSKLGASLAASWGIGLVARLIVPRYLGPQMFGAFQFADYFTGSFLVLTLLGVDTYMRKEVGLRKKHASDFFGGLLVLRLILSVAAIGIMFSVLVATGKPEYVRRLVLIFSAYQVFNILDQTYASLLQAVSAVDGLSIASVLSKVLWAGGILAAAGFGWVAEAFAAALVFSEGVKAGVLTLLVRQKTGLTFRVDMDQTWQVVVASLPFCVGV